MRSLEAAPSVFAFTFGLKALLMLVEMAGLMCKLMLVAPGRYGLRSALGFETDAAASIDAAATRIDEFAEASATREERSEERNEIHDRNRRRRDVTARARRGYASFLRDALDGSRGGERNAN